tara:strand:+ start:37532 stop:38125 length:594 start_codon:yes stop_codon:yes gene_type:complete
MIFRCSSCGKWKFFEKKVEGICSGCLDLKKDSEYYFVMEERISQKAIRKIDRDRELNESLKKELSEVKVIKKKVKKVKEVNVVVKEKKRKLISKENEAEKMSSSFDSVLYVYGDVKRVRVVEWKKGKKRIALNKSREIRHTHKGGFSQEKFQKFVDTKKRNWLEWIEDNLRRDGVLRGPYDKIVVEGISKEFVRSFL